jgi:hypothetical protein
MGGPQGAEWLVIAVLYLVPLALIVGTLALLVRVMRR